jgi:uncharacterized protein (DUF1697 family)
MAEFLLKKTGKIINGIIVIIKFYNMTKYLALLRGINVGGKNKVEMKKLKTIFENVGFANVFTFINSGNVIFESKEKNNDKLITLIKSKLKKSFNFDVPLLIRDQFNIKKLAANIPPVWENNEKQRTDILFLWDEFDNRNSIKLIKQVNGVDNIIYCKGAIVWNINKTEYKRSGMNKFIGTTLYKNMTARNVNTVRKIANLMN